MGEVVTRDVSVPRGCEEDLKDAILVNEQAVQQNRSIRLKEELEEEPEPISIKEILARLDGVFPMDEAVIEGDP